MKETITTAHSPDANGILMYMAIKLGWIGSDFGYKNTALDIQALNDLALKNEFDATAISFGLCPLIAKEYTLLRTAVNFGEDYGPKLVKKQNTHLKRNFKVALSGVNITNALISRMRYPEVRITYRNFLEIENVVSSGKVDAGVLIHESILELDSNLCVEAGIWDIWLELTREDLPLPLGGVTLRRSLSPSDAIKIERDLTNAVETTNSNRCILVPMLMERDLIHVSEEKLDTYLNLYANEDSICMSRTRSKAADAFSKLGCDYKFHDKIIHTRDYLIPSEYEEFRNS